MGVDGEIGPRIQVGLGIDQCGYSPSAWTYKRTTMMPLTVILPSGIIFIMHMILSSVGKG